MRAKLEVSSELLEVVAMGNLLGCWNVSTSESGGKILENFEDVAYEIESRMDLQEFRERKDPADVYAGIPEHLLSFRDRVRQVALSRVLSEKPPRFIAYICDGKPISELSEYNVYSAARNYEQFYQRVRKIRAITTWLKRSNFEEENAKRLNDFELFSEGIERTTINVDWGIESTAVVDNLLHGVDVRRFKICDFCGDMFFAQRLRLSLRKQFCSVKCGNASRQRKYLSDTFRRDRDLEIRRRRYELKNLMDEIACESDRLSRTSDANLISKRKTRCHELTMKIRALEEKIKTLSGG